MLNIKITGRVTIDYDICKQIIIPKFIVEKGIPRYIEYIIPEYHLRGFLIKRLNNRLKKVEVFGVHPNADLNTGELCLKSNEIGAEIKNIESLKNMLINRLEVYYYDESHFRLENKDYRTRPVDGYTKIDVNFEKGEIYGAEAPFRRLYPK